MTLRQDIPKMRALAVAAFQQTIRQRAELVGRGIFFLLLLYIFSQLWSVVEEDQGIAGMSVAQGVWYLAGADWMLLALPLLHKSFEHDLRSGDVVYALGRPLPWVLSRYATSLGEFAARMIFLLPFGIGGAWLLGGAPEPTVLWMLLLAPLAGVLGLVIGAMMGLCAVWMHEVSPLWFIFVKFLMVLGGLIVPLTFYPDWFREIAELTPFAHMIFGVGRMAFETTIMTVVTEAAHLVAWLIVMSLVLRWLNGKALNAVQAEGG